MISVYFFIFLFSCYFIVVLWFSDRSESIFFTVPGIINYWPFEKLFRSAYRQLIRVLIALDWVTLLVLDGSASPIGSETSVRTIVYRIIIINYSLDNHY